MATESLQKQWTTLYRTTLPSLAKKRSPAQPKWPVYLDHCFARIILDNAVGETQPWTNAIKSPAVKNMSDKQLKAAIEMGKDIANGKVDLVVLDNRSLELRGKKQKIPKGRETSKPKAASAGPKVEGREVDVEKKEEPLRDESESETKPIKPTAKKPANTKRPARRSRTSIKAQG